MTEREWELAVFSASKTVEVGCITDARVETNRFQGGDTGHGGFASFEIRTEGGDFRVRRIIIEGEKGEEWGVGEDGVVGFRIVARGDWEIEGLLLSLEFAAKELRSLLYKDDGERR